MSTTRSYQHLATNLAGSLFETKGAGVAPATVEGHCPARTESEHTYCWKFKNNEPDAYYDFWMIKSIIQDPQSNENRLAVVQLPAANNHLLVITTRLETHRVMKSRYVKVMKSSHSNFGVVHMSRMKVREIYEGFFSETGELKHEVYRFDQAGELLSSSETTGPQPLPAFPFPVLPWASSERLLGSEAGQPRDMIGFRFARTEEVRHSSDGSLMDLILDGGEALTRPALSAHLSLEPTGEMAPGYYVELVQQNTRPGMSMMLAYRVTENNRYSIQFTKVCTDYEEQQFMWKMIVKKKKSWFKKKKKVTIIIEELTKTGSVCSHERFPFL